MLVISDRQLKALEAVAVDAGARRLAAAGFQDGREHLRQVWNDSAHALDALGCNDTAMVDRLARIVLTPSKRSPDLVAAAVHAALTRNGADVAHALAVLETQLF